MTNDHTIPLDDMLADAAEHLKDQSMLSLSAAVDLARARLQGADERESTTRLRTLDADPDSQVQLSLAAVM